MKVIVPFANEHSDPIAFGAVSRNLARQNVSAKFFEIHDAVTYAELFNRIWNEGQPFIIVEHDIVPWPGALTELANCPEPWCGFPYAIGTDPQHHGLGCTKFHPVKLGSCPIPLSDKWLDLDNRLNAVLNRERGHSFHTHQPAVSHLRLAA